MNKTTRAAFQRFCNRHCTAGVIVEFDSINERTIVTATCDDQGHVTSQEVQRE